jgi:hypothetical protein
MANPNIRSMDDNSTGMRPNFGLPALPKPNFLVFMLERIRDVAGAAQGLREEGLTGQGSGRGARDTCEDITVGRVGLHKAHWCMCARCAPAPFRVYGPYGATLRTDVAGAAQGLWEGGITGQGSGRGARDTCEDITVDRRYQRVLTSLTAACALPSLRI